ncbi:MAG: ATP-binding protein [Hyphomonadaceae bacterium]|nr:ATP-binding protein [Hyphomonadaceae bacterium]
MTNERERQTDLPSTAARLSRIMAAGVASTLINLCRHGPASVGTRRALAGDDPLIKPEFPLSDATPREPVQPPSAETFSMDSVIELDRKGLVARVTFAGLFGLASLLVIPWAFAAAWMAAIVTWEWISSAFINPWTVRLPTRVGVAAFASRNVIGGSVYGLVALGGLAIGTPLGVVMGTVWLSGAFMNNFVYHGENRAILVASLTPSMGIAILGPQIGHGVTLGSMAISGLILSMFLAARAFSMDHQVLLKRLGERQAALAEVERKLSLAIDAAGDGTFEIDLIGGQSRVTAGWARMMGYEPDEVTDDLFSYIHPEDAPAVQQAFEAHFAGESPQAATEQRMLCKDGAYKWVLARGSLVERTADGRPARVIGTTVDISERMALEFDLKAARDVAEEANLAKSMFLANVSHEIRTPMNGVLGALHLLERENISPEGRELMRQASDCGRMLSQLLNDVLDFSKIEAGQLELAPEAIDPREALDAVVALLAGQARAKGVELRSEFVGEQSWVDVDPARLRQVMFNLIGNAVKFTIKGHVAARLIVGPIGDGGCRHVTLEVEDTGIGMSAQAQARLFERFRQAESDTARRFGGTGLGLAISQCIARTMGGEIICSSVEGQGSTFRLEFDAPEAAPVEAVVTEGGVLEGVDILLVEDNPTNRLVAHTMLTRLGANVDEAEDGLLGVEAARRGSYDVILMDVQMPHMNGVDATRAIRGLVGPASQVPIIGLTANVMEHQRTEYLAAGMDGVVAKPISPAALITEIARLVK